MKTIRLILGDWLSKLGRYTKPHYWVCNNYGEIKFKEEEVLCWKCTLGEMIYKGEIK